MAKHHPAPANGWALDPVKQTIKGDSMTDFEVENALGYMPCICGVLDGEWHLNCYEGITKEQHDISYVKVIKKARKYLEKQAQLQAAIALRSMENSLSTS